MARSVVCIGGIFLVVVAALVIGLHKTGYIDVSSAFRRLPEVDEAFQRGFRSDSIARINRLRAPMGVEEVRGDEEIQNFLNRWISTQSDPESISLEEVFSAIQKEYPGAQYLAANLITGPGREDLLSRLQGWSATANSDFDVVNTAVFKSRWKLGVLSVMSRRIPEFSIDAANENGGRFHNRCPHCEETHALDIEKDFRTLILTCPYCERPFDVLASDSSGNIKRAPDFFQGFQLIERDLIEAGASEKQRVVALWKRVADRCEYQLDQDRSNASEMWKRPQETWDDKAGDCEDTSILLADILQSAGFDARVAIGWNGNIGQHAWVVVRIGEEQFVIESTLQSEITEQSLTSLEEAAPFYKPEQLFDSRQIYYSAASPEMFSKEYFDPRIWLAVPRAGEFSPTLSIR